MTTDSGSSPVVYPAGVQTVEALIADLFRAYPKQPFPDLAGTHAVYVERLRGIDPSRLAVALAGLVDTESFLPTVADIKHAVAEQTLGLPTEAEALQQIAARQEWARTATPSYDDHTMTLNPPAPPVHDLVQQALREVGGWHAFRAAENQAVVRGQFGRIYRDLRDARIRDMQQAV